MKKLSLTTLMLMVAFGLTFLLGACHAPEVAVLAKKTEKGIEIYLNPITMTLTALELTKNTDYTGSEIFGVNGQIQLPGSGEQNFGPIYMDNNYSADRFSWASSTSESVKEGNLFVEAACADNTVCSQLYLSFSLTDKNNSFLDQVIIGLHTE